MMETVVHFTVSEYSEISFHVQSDCNITAALKTWIQIINRDWYSLKVHTAKTIIRLNFVSFFKISLQIVSKFIISTDNVKAAEL